MIMTDHHAATAPLMSALLYALSAAVCPLCKTEEADTVFLSTAFNFANQRSSPSCMPT